jgi:hypothetical protein
MMGEINQDPSMEEILASIKRVISDEGAPSRSAPRPARGGRPEPAPPVEAAMDDEDDVLELNDPVSEDDGLMSDNAAAASRSALAALAAMRQQETAAAPAVSDGPLEAVVKEMLKPMLKEWLDQRLPEIVEELVTREIARITGKSF